MSQLCFYLFKKKKKKKKNDRKSKIKTNQKA